MRLSKKFLGMTTALSFAFAGQVYAAEGDIMVVFDASGSMWGQIDGKSKIEIAREAFAGISTGWASTGQSAGLIAYGHRRKGDCADIEVLSTPSKEAAATMSKQVSALSPKGKTPLSAAVRQAADVLKFAENAATVILLSDGIETCDLDPCAMSAELEKLGVNFTAHVIGFDIQSDADRAQLQCIADNTGGKYLDARNADELSDGISNVTATEFEDQPLANIAAHLVLQEADGTARPARVTLRARNNATNEILELGVLEGAEDVITGLPINLAAGRWTFSAEGDGGFGEISVDLSDQSDRISIPFAASDAVFKVIGPDRFKLGEDITFQLRSLKPLQENATYYIALVPAQARQFDQNITFVYRFGTDPETTDHVFYAWEYDIPVGAYEIIVQTDGVYDFDTSLARFAFEVHGAD